MAKSSFCLEPSIDCFQCIDWSAGLGRGVAQDLASNLQSCLKIDFGWCIFSHGLADIAFGLVPQQFTVFFQSDPNLRFSKLLWLDSLGPHFRPLADQKIPLVVACGLAGLFAFPGFGPFRLFALFWKLASSGVAAWDRPHLGDGRIILISGSLGMEAYTNTARLESSVMKFGAMNNPARPVLKEISRISSLGFDFADLTVEEPEAGPHRSDWNQVLRLIEDLDLGIVGHTGPYLPIENPSLRVREAAYAELRSSIDVAGFLGATVCTMHFRMWPGFQTIAEGVDMYVAELGQLVAYGQSKGVQVAMENSPHNLHQLKPFREILHGIPDLKLLYDIGHGNINTPKSLTRDYLFDLRDRLVHIHLSDNDGTGDDHLPLAAPKLGGLKINQEFQQLRNFNYDETLTLEIFGHPMWLKASLDLARQLANESGHFVC